MRRWDMPLKPIVARGGHGWYSKSFKISHLYLCRDRATSARQVRQSDFMRRASSLSGWLPDRLGIRVQYHAQRCSSRLILILPSFSSSYPFACNSWGCHVFASFSLLNWLGQSFSSSFFGLFLSQDFILLHSLIRLKFFALRCCYSALTF